MTESPRHSPQQRLHAARLDAREGRHAEALREFVWFYDHALEEEPSLYGVRLSFALSYWMELAADYPPALRALQEIRDARTGALMAGSNEREAFHEVVALNEALGSVQDTYQLFARLAADSPDLARDCAELALPAVVAAGDFRLAERYLPEPEAKVRSLGATLTEDVERISERPRSKAPLYRALVNIFAEDVKFLLTVLAGVGRGHEGNQIRALALESVKTASVRKAVAKAMESAEQAG